MFASDARAMEADDYEDSAVQDFLEILEEHRRNCERQGKYTEAEVARTRLEELKMHEENRRKEAMRSRQIAERLGVEEAYKLEYEQFKMVWDKKIADYDENAAKLVIAMKVWGVDVVAVPVGADNGACV